ncbi:hypothetical protein B566_EDAN016618 [Ephemera danica]|nr:hypothetical protein B566_EDAN016618 [Ephemera danica]
MPISEDEYEDYEHHASTQHPQPTHGMTKAELRKSTKPIMEKKRRARINHCLNELKSLILDAMKKDPARHSKLEKADILEMTVKHLQNVQRQQLAVAVATDPAVLHKFRTGFSECATEVNRYIGRLDGVDQSVRQRLVAHLSTCVSGLQQLSPYSFMSTPVVPAPIAPPAVPAALPQVPFPAGDVNNNHGLVSSSSSRLSSDVTSTQQPFFPPAPSATVTSGAIDRSRPSAFTAVTRSSSPRPPSPGVTSSSDESACGDTPGRRLTGTEVQLQLKTMPVSRLTSSVGTSTSPPPSRHALDFSMKPPPPRKRSLEEDGPPERKMARFSLHVPTFQAPQQPSVLAGTSNRHPPAGGHDSMWRPW